MDKNILGKYVPYNTAIHRLDPRMKILGMIMLIVSIFLSFGSWTLVFTLSGINASLIFILMLISKVRLRDLIYQLRSIWILVIILMIINIFLPPINSEHIIAEWGNFKLYAESFLQSAKIILRLLEMFGVAMILTATTTPQQLTYGFSFFIKPLKKIKFPVEEVAMTISIALRFIPTLLEETDRIYKAQASRGIDFKHGSIKDKFKGIISLIIPLFVSSFAMSDDLAFALEARGYNPKAKRTQYRQLRWKMCDTIVLILVILYMAAFITLFAMKFDFMKQIFPLSW
ncbi:MAG: energy-coupling factor transporter transmembrane protein EcfT [Bacilli bacterium]|nr:energy-coupling factor transporter transmembrane protein EcfT [Bacilli bacterium]